MDANEVAAFLCVGGLIVGSYAGGGSGYDEAADLYADDVIDGLDLGLFGRAWLGE